MPRKAGAVDEADPAQRVRCAIYTRKSSEEGLEQSFNSLDAQREAGEAYIASQRHQGWMALPDRYDDGGYTGANLERPALQRLLAEIANGTIDCVVVYKVDRLSRSLLDFARIIAVLDQRGTSFVSITQQFNTTASIGRLTLNILLSFAQFEREIIAERTRDKMAAARRKGKWVGGVPPLGYRVASGGGRLEVEEQEAEVVREIFTLYGERQSVMAVVEELNRRGRTSKRWTSGRGREHGGLRFSKSAVAWILRNRVYTGQVEYRGEVFVGEQAAVMEPEVWEEVQRRLASRPEIQPKTGGENPLRGLLYCGECGVRMLPTYVRKKGRRYRYYVCLRAQQRGWKNCPTKSVSAVPIEQAVWERVRTIGPLPAEPELTACTDQWLRDRVERFTYDRAQNQVRIVLRNEMGGGTVEVPLVRFGHQERKGRLPRITRLMALALRCQEWLRSGTVKDYAELARVGIVTRPRMTQVMNLLNLAPQIQEEILFLPEIREGREPVSERALRRLPGVLSWNEQLELWHELWGLLDPR